MGSNPTTATSGWKLVKETMFKTTPARKHAPIGHSRYSPTYWHWIRPGSVAVSWVGGQVHYITARWVCGGFSADVALNREPPDGLLPCAACEAARYRKYLHAAH